MSLLCRESACRFHVVLISPPFLAPQETSEYPQASGSNSREPKRPHLHLSFHAKKSHKHTEPIAHWHPLDLYLKNNLVAMPSHKELEVVKGLDLQRYMGRWYEIASFPSFFQPKNGINTRATYTLKEDGNVNVLNETWSGGKRDFIEGTAYKADPNSDEAKLKVKFYVPPFLPIIPVVGDYWVMYMDEDYQYALIGQPSRKYLWILCRQNSIDEEIYNQLVNRAKEQGYDVSKLQKTPQTNPPPEATDAPNDTKGIWWIKSLFGK